MRSERVGQLRSPPGDDDAVRRRTERSRMSLRTLGAPHRPPSSSSTSSRPSRRAALRRGRPDGRVRLPGLLHREHPALPATARGLGRGRASAAATDIVTFQVSLTDSLVTMIGLTAARARRWPSSPAAAGRWSRARCQNFVEWAYESLSGFGRGIGGPAGGALRPPLRRVLPAHPVLQLERPRAAASAASRGCARPPAT